MNPPALIHHRSVEDQYPLHQQHYHRQTRSHQPQTELASALNSNPYSKALQAPYAYSSTPTSPPSPPEDEVNKPSLPSISSLLTMADTDRPGQESASQIQQAQQAANNSRRQSSESQPEQVSQAYGLAIVSNPRMTLPPTPPMRPDSTVDGNQSPSTLSSRSNFSSQSYHLGNSLNNMEPHQQRQIAPPAQLPKRLSLPSQPSLSPYANSPYASSPGTLSTGSYYSPEHPMYGAPPIYGQRPLPSNFPPPPIPINGPVGGAGNPWQHHHYISASSQAAFPQSQDRYICQTCNKAFSRPSSLRIHSHSHTGEKPFKCPHAGCGKAFSVRSNMKRHERGCHTDNPSAVAA